MESLEKKQVSWTAIKDLQEPFNDAVNYKTRQQKDFFNQIFLRTDDLLDCLRPNIYYLIGEKGSGKTAYAAYLENNDVEGSRCQLSTMTESQYKRFIALKRQGKLDYSDYPNIWRPMLLNMMAQTLVKRSKGFIASVTGKFDEIEKEIDSFDRQALIPEVEVAFEMIKEIGGGFSGGYDKIASIHADAKIKESDKTELIKHHLLDKETRLKQAIADLGLKHSHVLFIDGIDYRPEDVPYNDYLACIKGLGEAVWQLNSEFFGNIRDSKGRLKVVMLVRPDVFHLLNLYNSNSRLRDNSVLLNWATAESNARQSALYEATGKYFASQQPDTVSAVDAGDQYFVASENNGILRRLLRTSFQKPRDMLTFVKLAKDISVKKLRRGEEVSFRSDIVKNPDFTREYADYLLGEVKNYSAFYMEQSDFYLYIKFFQYLDGKAEFDFTQFKDAFHHFKNWIAGESVAAREYLRDPEALLQFFYDINVVGYREQLGADSEQFVHFSFRERSLTNIAPKIKSTGTLFVNPGVSKALDIGLRTRTKGGDQAIKPGRRRRKTNSSGPMKAIGKVGGPPKSKPSEKQNPGIAPNPRRRRRRGGKRPPGTPAGPPSA